MPKGYKIENWFLKRELIRKYGRNHSLLTGVFAKNAIELSHFYHSPHPNPPFYLSEANVTLLTQIEHFSYHRLLKEFFLYSPSFAFDLGGLSPNQNEFALRELRQRVLKNRHYFKNYKLYFGFPVEKPRDIVLNLTFGTFLLEKNQRFCPPIEQNLASRGVSVPSGLVSALWGERLSFDPEI